MEFTVPCIVNNFVNLLHAYKLEFEQLVTKVQLKSILVGDQI